MIRKPRIGSDPFRKKDPLGWIVGGQAEEDGQQESVQSPPIQPSNPEKANNSDKPSTQGRQSKAGNPSKQDLPSPPSHPDNSSIPSKPRGGSTTSQGLRPGWTRATFIVRGETLRKLKAAAYWERKELKRVMEEALTAYLQTKDFPPIPEEPSLPNS